MDLSQGFTTFCSVNVYSNSKPIHTCDHVDEKNVECTTKITEKGQELIFGNIHFINFCREHIKSCVCCNSEKVKYQLHTSSYQYFCGDCFEKKE